MSATCDIVHLYLSTGHNFFGHHGGLPGQHPMVEQEALHCVAGRGIEGDRFLDHKQDYKGQITFLAEETYLALCAQFDRWDLPPSVFRRNVITRGLDLNALVGQEFELQGVRFVGTEESKPCHWMDHAFAPGAETAMKGRGGLRARILSSGVLRCTVAAGVLAAQQSCNPISI